MITTEIPSNLTSQIIKNMRSRAGFTQKQLGKLVHLSDMIISRYESGKVIPNLDTVLKIAKVCGFELQFIHRNRVFSIKEMLREY